MFLPKLEIESLQQQKQMETQQTQNVDNKKNKLSIVLGVLWAVAVILIILWILCMKGNTDSALSKLTGQPTNLPKAGDNDNQMLSLVGNQLTLSNGNTVNLTNIVGPPGANGSNGLNGSNGTIGMNGATGPAGATGATGPVGPPGPGATVPVCAPGEYVVGNGVSFSCVAGPTLLVTNTLVNNGVNTLTSTVNGVAAAANIINSNVLSWTQAGGLSSTVNGVNSTQAIPGGTALELISYDAAGNVVHQNAATVIGNNAITSVNGETGPAITINSTGPLTTTTGVNTVTLGLAACAASQSYVYNGAAWVCTNAPTPYIFQNGLTESPAGTVELGGVNPLLHDTSVIQNNFDFTLDGSGGGSFYQNSVNTGTGNSHGISSGDNIFSLPFAGTAMYSSPNPAAIAGGGEGSFVYTLDGQAGFGAQDGLGEISQGGFNPTGFGINHAGAVGNANISGGANNVALGGFDNATGSIANLDVGGSPGVVGFYGNGGIPGQIASGVFDAPNSDVFILTNNPSSGIGQFHINGSVNTSEWMMQDGVSGITSVFMDSNAGFTNFYNQSTGGFNNFTLDDANGITFASNIPPVFAPSIFAVSNNGDVSFDRELRPGGNAGNAGEVLVSQGAGLPPIWSTAVTSAITSINGQTGPAITLNSTGPISTSTALNTVTLGLTPCAINQSYVYSGATWICQNTVLNAQNGTSIVGNSVELGANPLLHDTTIPYNGNVLQFAGNSSVFSAASAGNRPQAFSFNTNVQINGGGSEGIWFTDTTSGPSYGGFIYQENLGPGSLNIGTNNAGGAVRFYTGNVEEVTLNGNGNLGIGDTSPTTKLTVAGTGAGGSAGIQWEGVASAPALSTAGAGRVYFNSTTNQFQCSVNGGAYSNCINSAANIYNSDGTLTGTRTLTQGGFTLNFVGSSQTNTFGTTGEVGFNGAPIAGKVASFYGDIKVTGVIDPTALLFSDQTPSSYNPATNNGYRVGVTGAVQRPIFVSPLSDTTRTFEVRNAANTGTVLDVDSLNSRVGVNVTAPTATLHTVSNETTNNAATITGNNLTTGTGLAVSTTNTAMTGNILSISSPATAPAPASGIARFNFTGDHSGVGLQVDDVTTTGQAMVITASNLTSGVGLRVRSQNVAQTGSTIRVESNSTGAAGFGLAAFNFSGDHTGIGLRVDDVTTAGNIATIFANSLTSGSGLRISSALNAAQTGNSLLVDTGSTSAVTNGLVRFNFAGAHTGNGFQIDDVTATGTAMRLSTSALTTGSGLEIVNTSAAVNSTNGVFRVANTSATTTGILARFQANSTAGSGMTILANGNIGIGTTIPDQPLTLMAAGGGGNNGLVYYVNGGTAGNLVDRRAQLQSTANGGQFELFGNAGNPIVRFGSNGGNFVAGGGHLGVGSTTVIHMLDVVENTSGGADNGYVARIRNNSTNTTANGIVIEAGSNTAPGTTFMSFSKQDGTQIGSIVHGPVLDQVQYNTTSDVRLKENINETHFGLDTVLAIGVRDYNYKSDATKTQTTGFIAQDLYKLYPNAVTVGSDEVDVNGNLVRPWQVDYSKLTPLLAKGIQDLNAKTESNHNELLAKLASQDASINKLNDFTGITQAPVVTPSTPADSSASPDFTSLAARLDALEAKNTATTATTTTQNTQSVATAVFNGGVVTGDVEFQGQATFVAAATFKGTAVFNGDATFNGDVKVNGNLAVSDNTAGSVTIPAGQTTVTVSFAKPHAVKPVISVTPGSAVEGNYFRSNVTTSGFTIKLVQPQATATTFDWTAFEK